MGNIRLESGLVGRIDFQRKADDGAAETQHGRDIGAAPLDFGDCLS
jgi:hypothetical protein